MMDAKTKLYGGRSNGSKIAPKKEPTLSRNLVSLVTSNICLGVILGKKLTFETHIEYICKKACAGIGALRRIKPFVPLCTLVTLYRSFIQPYFDYCSPLWDTYGRQLKNKFQKIQNRAEGL